MHPNLKRREHPPAVAGGNPLLHKPVDAYTTSPEGKAETNMTENLLILKRIEEHLEVIRYQIGRSPIREALAKPAYSCRELARLTHTYGVQSYREYTVRLACNEGRIPEAYKRDNGNWLIPRDAVLRVLQDGLRPERRHGHLARLPDNA